MSPAIAADGRPAATKLCAPARPDALVPRGALVDALVAGREAPLVAVTGPAGAGKTTLLGEWGAAPAEDRAFAWLSLDPEDGDPARFWRCVIEALRTVLPDFGAEAGAMLRAGGPVVAEAAVPLLAAEAGARERFVVLVLDDLHVLGAGAGAVHATLAWLVEHRPPTLQIAVAAEPTLPPALARLRAGGHVLEIGEDALRFDAQEAAALLLARNGAAPEHGPIRALLATGEGRPVVLQLAAAGGRDRSPAAAVDGVLAALPAPLADAALRLSLLDSVCAPLADAVTGRDDAAASLEELARRGLPVAATDGWWRCHPVLAGELRERLRHTATPDQLHTLHRRAARWHAEHGDPAAAIRHALAAGDTALAAGLVAEHAPAAIERGELALAAGWLDALPPRALRRDERLWQAALATATDGAALAETERRLTGRGGGTREIHAWVQLAHAVETFRAGDLAGAADRLDRATAIGAHDVAWRRRVAQTRALEAFWRGHPRVAYRHFSDAAALAEAHEERFALAYALGYLALIAADGGDHDRARRRLGRLDDLRDADPAVGEHCVAFAGALAEGRMLELAGAYEGAVAPLRRAVALAARGAGRMERAEPLLRLAAVHRGRGRVAEAAALEAEARELLEGCAERGRLAGLAAATAPAVAPVRDDLSLSEMAVLRLLPTDLSQREIGAELYLSVNTVKTHCRNIYAKLGAGSREQAVARARELRLL